MCSNDVSDLYVPMGLQMCNELKHVATRHRTHSHSHPQTHIERHLYLSQCRSTDTRHFETKTLLAI